MVFILEQRPQVPEEKETLGALTERSLARSGARAAESILGIPGELQSLMQLLGEKGAEALGVPEEVIKKTSKFAPLFTPFGKLPTSTEIKETITEPLTGEYLKPRGKIE